MQTADWVAHRVSRKTGEPGSEAVPGTVTKSHNKCHLLKYKENIHLQWAPLTSQERSLQSSLSVMLRGNSFAASSKIFTVLLLKGAGGEQLLVFHFGEAIQMCSGPLDSQKFHSHIRGLSFHKKHVQILHIAKVLASRQDTCYLWLSHLFSMMSLTKYVP